MRKSTYSAECADYVLCFGGLCTVLSDVSENKYSFASLFLSLAVAVTNEFIRSFLDKTSLASDILMDFHGAIIGFLYCSQIQRLFGEKEINVSS